MYQAREQAMRQRVQEVLALATQLYQVQINPSVSFNLKGRVAGYAGCKICAGQRQYFLRFNCELIGGKHFDDMMNDTVPHEVAHLVAMSRPELGASGHNEGWKRICIALGGTGLRCHNYDVVVRGRWDYITDRGHKVSVTKRYHNYVQQGGTLTFKKGLGVISKSSPCAPSGQLSVAPKPASTDAVSPATSNYSSSSGTANKTRRSNADTGTSWASRVRLLIAAAKSAGGDQASVIAQAVALGMLKTSAVNCVKANWHKV